MHRGLPLFTQFGGPTEAVVKLLRGEPAPKNVFISHKIITRENLSQCDAAVGK